MTKERALYQEWLEAVKDNEEEVRELKAIEGDDGEISDRFYRDLEFGTGGLRGVLGLGANRMNVYTVRRATQGLATCFGEGKASPSAAIAYDSRNCSDLFARETACVLAANGFKVYLYRELMPTPALSYAVRELHCDCGVVITASHNPAKYNGYKAYGSDGCQIGPEQADKVLDCMGKTDLFTGVATLPFDKALAEGKIEYISEEFIRGYIDRVYAEALNPEVCAKAGLRLVYTPLNGAGRRCVTAVLDKLGMTSVSIVKEQELPDGNFPTCPYPNPEIRETLTLGLALCEKEEADLLLATDPDCDRMAAAVKDGAGYRVLTGNEVGVLLLDYIAKTRKAMGTLPEHPVAVKSIVSSKLADLVAADHGVEMVDVLTGFKFIGEVIAGLEEKGQVDRYIFGFEESCGYLSGPYVRDKDGVNASLLLVEMASAYKLARTSVCQVLDDIYQRFGFFANEVDSFTFEGADGMKKMADIMDTLRENPPVEIAGCPTKYWVDYRASLRVEKGAESPISLPKSNVLEFGTEEGCTVIVRPSGTEPKIKLYYSIVSPSKQETGEKLAAYRGFCEKMIGV